MSEKIENDAIPQADEKLTDTKDTTPEEKSEVFVPVKFNKQLIKLNLQQAQELAQKGMKFDAISADYQALKNLALAEGKNVGEYIATLESNNKAQRLKEIAQKCGGDTDFAEHILKSETVDNGPRGLDEVIENFPKIKGIEDLPQSVVDAAALKGTLLLDEYLRYLHLQDVAAAESLKKQKETENSATGLFTNKSGAQSPETVEFLKGLWQR